LYLFIGYKRCLGFDALAIAGSKLPTFLGSQLLFPPGKCFALDWAHRIDQTLFILEKHAVKVLHLSFNQRISILFLTNITAYKEIYAHFEKASYCRDFL
jgi:hypothetical protein